MHKLSTLPAWILAAGVACRPAPAAEPPPSFVGKAWMSVDPSAPAGSIRIFLADGTLVMDSCGETYRLAAWRPVADRIEWTEDTARIEAEVLEQRPDVLRLRLHLRSEVKDESYRVATAPYVCPDLPR